LRKSLFFVLLILYFSDAQTTTRNHDIEVKKTSSRIDSERHDWKIEVSWRAIGSGVSKIQVIDDIVERFTVIEGSLVHEAKKDPTTEWSSHSYILRLDVDKSLLSLSNSTHEITLPGAQVSYLKAGETERRSITTPTTAISVNVEDEIIIKGGWLLDANSSTGIVAFFTIIFPIWAAYAMINNYHAKALARGKSE